MSNITVDSIKNSKLFTTFLILTLVITSSTFLLSSVEKPTPNLGKINVPDKGVFDLSTYPNLDRRTLGIWNSLRDFYSVTDLSNSSINDLSILPPILTQYFLAFSVYGMAQLVDSTPNYRSDYYTQLFDKMILMMNSSTMEQFEWIDPGYSHEYYEEFGNSFRGPTNIMWTGHYALMELLYYNVFRDPKYNSEIKWYMDDWNKSLTITTTWENKTSIDSEGRPLGKWGCGLIPCEPYIVFVQCNSIPFYAMRLYDSLFGTTYQDATIPGIDWWQANMVDTNGIQIDGYFNWPPHEPEQVIRSDLPPSYPGAALTSGKPEWPKVASYGSAWAAMFYNGMGLTEISNQYYQNWKKMFIHYTTDDMAYSPNSYHYPSSFGMMDLIGNLFGYFCAREMMDWELMRKLENWFYGPFPGAWDEYNYRFDTSALGDLGSFFDPILNFAYAWAYADSTLTSIASPRPDAFYSQEPYIFDESTHEGLFIYQAYYDVSSDAFILTVEANKETVLYFENFHDPITGIYMKSGLLDSTTWSQNGSQLELTLSPGVYSFVIV